MKIKTILLPLLAGAVILSGCSKQSNPTGDVPTEIKTEAVTETEAPTEEPTEEGPSVVEGMERSPLTGEWVEPEVAARRPFAVMINNVKEAIPQSGIARAEVLYEAYVEGNITRLMMITQNYDGLEKIGPVRSCREYYVYFAKEYEAAYVHFGKSILAAELLSKSVSNSMDGNDGWCSFYRSTDRKAPHNAYTTTEGILGSMDKKNISVDLPSGFTQPLAFNEYDDKQIELENGTDCTSFKPGYTYNKPEFKYNKEDGLYYRYQFDSEHVDMETGEQLAFKNILVKYVDSHLFDNYTPVLNLEGKGEGLFITNGKAVEVTWEKNSEFGATKYYYADGTEVVLNQGKVMVCVIPNSSKSGVEVK